VANDAKQRAVKSQVSGITAGTATTVGSSRCTSTQTRQTLHKSEVPISSVRSTVGHGQGSYCRTASVAQTLRVLRSGSACHRPSEREIALGDCNMVTGCCPTPAAVALRAGERPADVIAKCPFTRPMSGTGPGTGGAVSDHPFRQDATHRGQQSQSRRIKSRITPILCA
jgi:hypothetical protein